MSQKNYSGTLRLSIFESISSLHDINLLTNGYIYNNYERKPLSVQH